MKRPIWASRVMIIAFVIVKCTKAQCDENPLNMEPGSGTIVSQRYNQAGGYDRNLDCRWNFKESEERQYLILLDIVDIKLNKRDTCTGSLKIQNDIVDCLSTEPRCYSYRTSDICEKFQTEQHSDCLVRSTVLNFPMPMLFTSTNSNNGNKNDRKFKIDYKYLTCPEIATTVGTTQGTDKTEETTNSATTLISTTKLNEGSGGTTANTTLPTKTMRVSTTAIERTSILANTDGVSKTTVTVRTTTKTTEPNMNHVVAITLGTLMIILIIIGIVIIFLLFKKRSLPRSAEEFFGSVKNGNTPHSTGSDYDVVYKPRNNANPTYNSIEVGNGNPTFQTDEGNEYSEITRGQQIKQQNTPNPETSESDSNQSTSPAAEVPEYAVTARKNSPSEGDSDKNEDVHENEGVETSKNIEFHEYDLPPDVEAIHNADMTEADREPPLYENFQNEGETAE